MKRYMAHIELNHPNYEKFCKLSAQELANAQTEAVEIAEKYAYILNDSNCFDRPLYNVFRITIYEKTFEFAEKGIAIYQSISQCISEKFGFNEHYNYIDYCSNSRFYKVMIVSI